MKNYADELKPLMVYLVCVCCGGTVRRDDANAQSVSQTDHSQTAQVPASAVPGMVEHKTLPQYPKEAMLKGIQGDVVFKVAVDENGKIVRSQPVRVIRCWLLRARKHCRITAFIRTW